MKPKFKDLAALKEDARITQIVDALKMGANVGVLIDDEKGKADRYLAKIRSFLPSVIVVYRGAGPTKGCETLKLKMQNEAQN